MWCVYQVVCKGCHLQFGHWSVQNTGWRAVRLRGGAAQSVVVKAYDLIVFGAMHI